MPTMTKMSIKGARVASEHGNGIGTSAVGGSGSCRCCIAVGNTISSI